MFKKYFLFSLLIFYLIKIKALPPPLNKNKIKKSTEKEYYEEKPEIPPTRECPPYLEKYCYHGGTCFAAHVGNGNYRASCRCKPGWRDPRCLHLIDLGLYDIF